MSAGTAVPGGQGGLSQYRCLCPPLSVDGSGLEGGTGGLMEVVEARTKHQTGETFKMSIGQRLF